MPKVSPNPIVVAKKRPLVYSKRSSLKAFGAVTIIVCLATVICHFMYGSFAEANLIMVYLFGVGFVALRFALWEAIFAAVLSVVAFDVMFTEPRGTFSLTDWQYSVSLAIMLAVALLISVLSTRLKAEAMATEEREKRSAALYRLSKELLRYRDTRDLAEVSIREIQSIFAGDVAILLPGENGLKVVAASDDEFRVYMSEGLGAENARNAFWQDATSESPLTVHTDSLYLPLRGASSEVGVLAIRATRSSGSVGVDQKNLFETFANGIGLAMEGVRLAKQSYEANLQVEGEKIRNALLSSISHDLRTPLAAMASAAHAFSEGKGDAKELASTIYEETVRLNLQIQKLLDMTRLQSSETVLHLELHAVDELVGGTLQRIRSILSGHAIEVRVPLDLPLLNVDGNLLGKVILNLVENAVTHTPPGTSIRISAGVEDEQICLSVADNGLGLSPGQETKLFEPFVRFSEKGTGSGMGLAICKAIMDLHGGSIRARNRLDGEGAEFRIEFAKTSSVSEVMVG